MLYAFSYDGYCYIALPRMGILDFSDFGHRYVVEGSNLLEAATKKVLMLTLCQAILVEHAMIFEG